MKTLLIGIVMLIALPLAAAAQGGGGGGRGTGGGGGQEEPTYNKGSVSTLTGVVTALGSHLGKRGTPRSRATLKAGDASMLIHIGPTAFLDAKDFHLSVGDRVTVIGSKVKEDDGTEMVIVRQITRGTTVLMMRDEEGRPLWDDKYKG
ncbi:MAG: hypothetical protein ABI665_29060 [Vicinamibacterales bacterium]